MDLGLKLIALRVAGEHRADINKLSDQLLRRLAGFVDEVENLTREIVNTAGNKSIWKDREKGGAEQVKSSIEQLLHLTGEFESLAGYLEKRYNNKTIKGVINNLVSSLKDMAKSGKKGLFQNYDDYVEKVRESSDLINSRVRACRQAIDQMAKTSAPKETKTQDDPLKDFDFNKL